MVKPKQVELQHITLKRLNSIKNTNYDGNDYWLRIPKDILIDLDIRPTYADMDMRVILINDRAIETSETAPQ